ncbi:Subtilase family protein [Mesorhizobium sp. NFR06]|uniref:S8 family serine peptidase n=1 Tax=Mesorhizobium sp. NFR06 TaxID=1566290 RepID=UPI0008E06FC2|nr:S8 family serine peptidase [Mesorhizobium sp. NFR06]SFO58286.1 Subtilase family protein [Mesorhizobium sp. NFR06]
MSGPRGYIFCESERANELDAILAQAATAPVRFKEYVEADLDSATLARVTAAGFETYLRPQAKQSLELGAQPSDAIPTPPEAGFAADTPGIVEPQPVWIAQPDKRHDPRLKRRFAQLASQVPRGKPKRGPMRLALNGSLTTERRQTLEDLGVRLLNFRKAYYQVEVPPSVREAVKALPFVASLRAYDLLDSVSSDLLRALADHDDAGRPPTLATYDALTHHAEDTGRLSSRLKAMPGVTFVAASVDAVRFCAVGSDALLARVATLPQVRMLTPVRAARLAVDHIRPLCGVAAAGGEVPLMGEGQIIAILDSGITDHPDFKGRIKSKIGFDGCDPEDIYGHGLHVAGIAAGSGAASGGVLRGIAPAAELVVIGMRRDNGELALPLDLGDLLRVAVDNGARIINCSWGTPVGAVYDSAALSVDRFVCAHPDVLVVFAAGNKGDARSGTHSLWTVGSPATAKNALAVGASGTDRINIDKTWNVYDSNLFANPAGAARMTPAIDEVALLSSAGPTDTRGIKPDLTAPGVWVLAPRLAGGPLPYEPFDAYGGQYGYLHGTSMAAPVVAGAAAILRQHLLASGPPPSAALMRALLISATRPMPALDHPAAPPIGYPDFDQGFGRLDLATLLPVSGSPSGRTIMFDDVPNDDPRRALTSGVRPGDNGRSLRRYSFTAKPGAVDQMRITLAWTDAPGADVQNDLQLLVTTPSNKQIVGNPDHKLDRIFGPPDAGDPFISDRHNTVEQVRIPSPEAGEYRVRVWARNTVYPPQGYALAICGELTGTLHADP